MSRIISYILSKIIRKIDKNILKNFKCIKYRKHYYPLRKSCHQDALNLIQMKTLLLEMKSINSKQTIIDQEDYILIL